MLLLTQKLRLLDGWGQEVSGHFTSFYHQNIKVQTFQQSQELFAAAASEVSWEEFIQLLPLQNPLSTAGKEVFLPAASVGWA